MKKIFQIAEGLTLLAPFDESGFSVAVGHDILWAGPDGAGPGEGKPLPVDVETKLKELGWFFDEEFDHWAVFV